MSSLGPQFIPITELNKMQAGDFGPGMYDSDKVAKNPHLANPQRVSDLSREHPIYKAQHYDWNALSEDVAHNGLEPLHVGSAPNMFEPNTRDLSKIRVPTLLNGHHRAVIAQEQGHMFVPVTSDSKAAESPYRQNVRMNIGPLKWKPLWREHLQEVNNRPSGTMGVHPDQGSLFPREQFTDRRKKKYGW